MEVLNLNIERFELKKEIKNPTILSIVVCISLLLFLSIGNLLYYFYQYNFNNLFFGLNVFLFELSLMLLGIECWRINRVKLAIGYWFIIVHTITLYLVATIAWL